MLQGDKCTKCGGDGVVIQVIGTWGVKFAPCDCRKQEANGAKR